MFDYDYRCPQTISLTLVDKARVLYRIMMTSLNIIKKKLYNFLYVVSISLHGFYEVSRQYKGNDRDLSQCVPTCLTTIVEMPAFYLSQFIQ